MPLRLIDTDVEVPVEVSGTKIIVKPLTQGNKLRLAFVGQNFQESISNRILSAADESELDRLLAGQIVRIDDPAYVGWNAEKIVAGMDYADKAVLMSELFRISTLNEEERKN